jgi:imidazoleglycerol-phosphate dehydratase
MKARTAKIRRHTLETQISLRLNLDGKGKSSVKTGIPFFDHMLTLFAKHATVDLDLRCVGDLEVDAHHTVEDCGIALGQAVAAALGDKRGIRRYGHGFHPKNPFTGEAYVPMDECLARCVVDFSGRPFLVWRGLDKFSQKKISGAEKKQDASSTFQRGALQPASGTALRRRAAPHRRGAVQGVCARGGCREPARPAHRRPAAQHQGETLKCPGSTDE